MSDEAFEKFRHDRDRRACERLLQQHRALVYSVCRRYLRDPDDVDDAAQETFLKLTSHSHAVSGSVTAWLVATAHSSSIDLIRRSIRERNWRHALGQVSGSARDPDPEPDHRGAHEAIRLRLHDAMAALELPDRALLIERFARQTLVAVVEPGTVHRGIVERTIRDYSLLGGLIEADDRLGLQTLDVLLIGNNFALSSPIIRAVNLAVRGGMGLLNEYWTRAHCGVVDDPQLQEIMLAGSRYYSYHTSPTCGMPLPVTAVREHALLPGLRAGTRIMLGGCGPAYRPAAGAVALMSRDRVVGPQEHGMRDVGALEMPAYLIGDLGRGRVAVVHAWPHNVLAARLDVPPQRYFGELLAWLAAPRREVV